MRLVSGVFFSYVFVFLYMISLSYTQNITSHSKCPLGNPFVSPEGHLFKCGCAPNKQCPDGYFCALRDADVPGVCCPEQFEPRLPFGQSQFALGQSGYNSPNAWSLGNGYGYGYNYGNAPFGYGPYLPPPFPFSPFLPQPLPPWAQAPTVPPPSALEPLNATVESLIPESNISRPGKPKSPSLAIIARVNSANESPLKSTTLETTTVEAFNESKVNESSTLEIRTLEEQENTTTVEPTTESTTTIPETTPKRKFHLTNKETKKSSRTTPRPSTHVQNTTLITTTESNNISESTQEVPSLEPIQELANESSINDTNISRSLIESHTILSNISSNATSANISSVINSTLDISSEEISETEQAENVTESSLTTEMSTREHTNSTLSSTLPSTIFKTTPSKKSAKAAPKKSIIHKTTTEKSTTPTTTESTSTTENITTELVTETSTATSELTSNLSIAENITSEFSTQSPSTQTPVVESIQNQSAIRSSLAIIAGVVAVVNAPSQRSALIAPSLPKINTDKINSESDARKLTFVRENTTTVAETSTVAEASTTEAVTEGALQSNESSVSPSSETSQASSASSSSRLPSTRSSSSTLSSSISPTSSFSSLPSESESSPSQSESSSLSTPQPEVPAESLLDNTTTSEAETTTVTSTTKLTSRHTTSRSSTRLTTRRPSNASIRSSTRSTVRTSGSLNSRSTIRPVTKPSTQEIPPIRFFTDPIESEFVSESPKIERNGSINAFNVTGPSLEIGLNESGSNAGSNSSKINIPKSGSLAILAQAKAAADKRNTGSPKASTKSTAPAKRPAGHTTASPVAPQPPPPYGAPPVDQNSVLPDLPYSPVAPSAGSGYGSSGIYGGFPNAYGIPAVASETQQPPLPTPPDFRKSALALLSAADVNSDNRKHDVDPLPLLDKPSFAPPSARPPVTDKTRSVGFTDKPPVNATVAEEPLINNSTSLINVTDNALISSTNLKNTLTDKAHINSTITHRPLINATVLSTNSSRGNRTNQKINTLSSRRPISNVTTGHKVNVTATSRPIGNNRVVSVADLVSSQVRFEDMLSPEFFQLHNWQSTPTPKQFWPDAEGTLSLTSGRFHACTRDRDCNGWREPREWTGNGSFIQVVNDRNCYCNPDTLAPSCIIERRIFGQREWTFCSPNDKKIQNINNSNSTALDDRKAKVSKV